MLIDSAVAVRMVALPWPWARSRPFYVLSGVLMTVGAAGFAAGAIRLAPLWAVLLGTGTAMTFAGANALTGLFARRTGQVAGYAAAVLTAGYALAFVGPLLGGVLVDRTHRLGSPFWIMIGASVALIWLGLTLPRRPAAKPLAD